MSNLTDIQVNEISAFIISYASFAQFYGELSQFLRGTSRQADIDGLSFHVQAIAGDFFANAPQLCIGGRGSVSRNDMEWR